MTHLLADAGLLDVNGTLIAEVIAFLLMVLILAKWVYPRIMLVATEREQKIEAGVRAAAEAEKRLLEVQEEVKKTLDEARAHARDILDRAHKAAVVETEELVRKGRKDAEAQLQRARAEITAERDRAIQEIRAQVGMLVVSAASKVLGQAIDRSAHSRLIEQSLAQVDSGSGRKAS
ncbi:MAG TPA: F0F1 ATP synthase subunit B [Candidatus Dormibacteraeota bacterium]|jgi:F-type H+-transporting ATPase subunit b